jgi:hypothetical protein
MKNLEEFTSLNESGYNPEKERPKNREEAIAILVKYFNKDERSYNNSPTNKQTEKKWTYNKLKNYIADLHSGKTFYIKEEFTVDIGGGIATSNPFYDESGRQYSEKLSPKAMKALKGTELGRAILAFEDIVDEYIDWKQSAPGGEDDDYLDVRIKGLKDSIKYLNSI